MNGWDRSVSAFDPRQWAGSWESIRDTDQFNVGTDPWKVSKQLAGFHPEFRNAFEERPCPYFFSVLTDVLTDLLLLPVPAVKTVPVTTPTAKNAKYMSAAGCLIT